jgi:hypothetical protein
MVPCRTLLMTMAAGSDVTQQSADTLAILNNTELIAVNQDTLGVQVRFRVAQC